MARTVTERADALPALAEAFRRHGYEGASLAVLTQHTGLGKGSLYNFFPGGKEEMALAVLDEVDAWFRVNVYEPLRDGEVPVPERLQGMTGAVEDYFTSRHLVCLFGAFALGQERERFGERIAAYFTGWIDALARACRGTTPPTSSRRCRERWCWPGPWTIRRCCTARSPGR